MDCVKILGVKISKTDYQSAIGKIETFLRAGGRHYVVTPNPEFLVLAQRDAEFRAILNRADLAVPDGVGLRMAAKFLSLPACSLTVIKFFQLLFQGLVVGAAAIFRPSFLDVLPETVTGTDLMLRLCGRAAKRGYTVFLLGGRDGVAEETAKRLRARFAKLNIIGTYEGDPSCNFQFSIFNFQSQIDLLFVAYGAPKQEKWIARNLSKIPVKVAMGVGGAFDFIAGKKKRAPRFLRRLGLEWLWRLLQEPRRLPRIIRATVKFPLLIFLHKLSERP